MKHASRPQAIAWFQEYYKAGRLELRPPFQRKPVWTNKQRSFLVESILMDVPIPEVYVQVTQAEDGTEQYGVVDGQQRLRTILQFVGIESDEDQEGEDINRFALESLPDSSPYKDTVFGDLSVDQRKTFFAMRSAFASSTQTTAGKLRMFSKGLTSTHFRSRHRNCEMRPTTVHSRSCPRNWPTMSTGRSTAS